MEGSTFALSPRLPRAAQRLELRALALTDQAFAGVRLELDGRVLARPSRPPYRTDWQLEPGRHEARAVAETVDGRQLASEVVRFDVVEEAEIE